MRNGWIGCAMLLWLLAGPCPAAEPGNASPAAGEVLALAEEVIVLNGVNPLRLTTEQIQSLLPHLRGAQNRLREAAADDVRSLAGLRDLLLQARQKQQSEGTTASSAEQQVTLNRQSAAQRQAQARRDLVASLRRQLTATLSTGQQSLMRTRGQELLASQRTSAWQQARSAALPVPPGGPQGGRGFGPGEAGPGRLLDRIREVPQAQFDQMVQRMSSRFGDRTTEEYERQRAFMQRVRAMPPDVYQQQRDQLGRQFFQARGLPGAAAADETEAAMEAFIDRYFLSVRIVPLLEEKARS